MVFSAYVELFSVLKKTPLFLFRRRRIEFLPYFLKNGPESDDNGRPSPNFLKKSSRARAHVSFINDH